MARGRVKKDAVRPRIDVNATIKAIIYDMRKDMQLRTEGEVLAYLISFHDEFKGRMTLDQRKKFLDKAIDLVNQQTIQTT